MNELNERAVIGTRRELPPGLRYPTDEEMARLRAEPNPYCTAGPYVGGWLCIGYRSIPLTEDEAAALFGHDAA